MDGAELTAGVRQEAARLGFDLCAFAAVREAPHADFFETWLALERAGEMQYLARYVARRRNPGLLAAPGAQFRSLIILAVDYHQFDLSPDVVNDPSRGLIARYAWGDDYHELIRPRLHELDAFVAQQSGRRSQGKCLVDTGPVLERDWAHAAGLGFTGKNCCTLRPGTGSWLLLAVLLVPEELTDDTGPQSPDLHTVTAGQVAAGLAGDQVYGRWTLRPDPAAGEKAPGPQGTCGRCCRCLHACPTDAFAGAYHLDPLRCIAYWTIETGAPVPHELRPRFGNRIFGCDICQEVCPYNRRLAARRPQFARLLAHDDRVAPPLLAGFQPGNPYWLADEVFAVHFRNSPLLRARRQGMLRNVCIALGNWAAPVTVPALAAALADPDPLPRMHAAWALGRVQHRHPDAGAAPLLRAALAGEADNRVQEELRQALAGA